MKIQREAVAGLFVIGAVGIARSVAAQEPWVAPENVPAGTTATVAVPPETPEPVVPTPGNITTDTGPHSNKFDHYMRPPQNAFELQLGMGYGQGFGGIGVGTRAVDELSGPGGTIQMTLGYRVTPHFMIGFYGTGSQFSRGNDVLSGTEVRSATAGLQADFHFRPTRVIDPWLSIASGWRGMWLTPDVGENTTLHGLQLARLQIGVDFRASPGVAIAPVVGADASMFLTQSGPAQRGFENVGDPRVNFFLFGGLQARFDVGGTASSAHYARSPSPRGVF
jgi:hypothetical protein